MSDIDWAKAWKAAAKKQRARAKRYHAKAVEERRHLTVLVARTRTLTKGILDKVNTALEEPKGDG